MQKIRTKSNSMIRKFLPKTNFHNLLRSWVIWALNTKQILNGHRTLLGCRGVKWLMGYFRLEKGVGREKLHTLG